MVSTSAAAPQSATPEAQRATADMRAATFGRLLAMLMASPRHAGMTLADANAFVAPPVALGQFAIASAKPAENGAVMVAAAAWWAFVSPEVDKRLSESRAPHLMLQHDEWRGGNQPWIIEAIGDPKIVNELIGKLAGQHFSGTPAKIRAYLPDGKVAVGRIEAKTPVAGQTKA